ncbi:MAG: nucleoside monophosphate kinase [bacterium]|jgi:adenylate kinase
MISVFLGPPGCGKGTQAARLAASHGLRHFDMGRTLRDEIESGSSLGKTIKTFTNKGELVPLPIIRMVVDKQLKENPEQNTILDGFPRSPEQAILLDEVLASQGKVLDCVVYFRMDERALIRRIVNRRYCPSCGRVYNLLYASPAQPGICDDDGTDLVQRPDDNEAVLMKRFRVYQRETEPILEKYRAEGKLCEVDAGRSIEEIEKELVERLKLE